MDRTETYIKMSEKAEEIQEGWLPSVGDWFLHDYHGTTGFGKIEDEIWGKEEFIEIECLTYKPSIDDYIEISGADGSRGVYTSSSLLKDRHIWLPRQDQLQEMVIDRNSTIEMRVKVAGMCGTFYEHFLCSGEVNTYEFTSMEQLWLAFYMWEKYNKEWDGKDWIERSETLN